MSSDASDSICLIGLTGRHPDRPDKPVHGVYLWRFAIWRSDLPGTTKQILTYLSCRADKAGTNCFPSVQRIADDTGRAKPTVVKHLALAERRGWIQRRSAGHGGKGHRRQEYVPHAPPHFLCPHGGSLTEPPSEDGGSATEPRTDGEGGSATEPRRGETPPSGPPHAESNFNSVSKLPMAHGEERPTEGTRGGVGGSATSEGGSVASDGGSVSSDGGSATEPHTVQLPSSGPSNDRTTDGRRAGAREGDPPPEQQNGEQRAGRRDGDARTFRRGLADDALSSENGDGPPSKTRACPGCGANTVLPEGPCPKCRRRTSQPEAQQARQEREATA